MASCAHCLEAGRSRAQKKESKASCVDDLHKVCGLLFPDGTLKKGDKAKRVKESSQQKGEEAKVQGGSNKSGKQDKAAKTGTVYSYTWQLDKPLELLRSSMQYNQVSYELKGWAKEGHEN